MKKIIILLLTLFLSLSGYSQFTPAIEGFESTTGPDVLPSTNWTLGTGTWAVFDNGVGLGQRWGINTTVATPPLVYQGTNAAYINRENIGAGNTSEDYLASPLVTIPTNGQLHFFTRTFTSGNQGTIYRVMVAPAAGTQTNPASYSLVQEWTEATLTTTFNIYEEKVVNLSAYAGQQVYIAFVMVWNQTGTALGDRWLVDDASIVVQCDDPTAATAGSINLTSATLSWIGTAPQYEIEIIPQTGTFTGTGTIINTNSYNATATTLGVPFTTSTTYNYRVRALCSGGVNSNWVGPVTFTTTSPGLSCAAPIIVGALPYSTTDDTANYSDNTAIEGSPGASGCGSTNGYLNGNDVVYSYTAPTTGIINVTMTPTATYSGIFVYTDCANIGISCIAGAADAGTTTRTFDLPVTAGTTYYFVISTWAAPQTTAYTLTIQVVNCAPSTTLNATNIGQSSAQLSWANPSGATSWEVAVQTAGSPIPSGSGVTTNTNTNYVAGGLTAATAYQYYVRADCGNGTFSVWAGPYLFNTSICDASQQCNYSFVMRDTFGDGWNGGTIQVRQNGIVVATLTGPTAAQGTTPVTVTIAMCDSTPFDLFWNVAGTFPGEIGVTVINSFGQTLYVKAPGSGTAGTVLYTGNVNCLVPECLAPTALTATNISETDALLGWTTSGPETSWQVLVQAAGLPAPTASSTGWVAAPTNPFNYPSLTSGTSYDFYVRPICSPTDIGAWSNVKNFNTSVCPLANQCNYTFVMTDSFGDGWNGGTMQVRQNGVVIATLVGPLAAQGTNPVTITVPLCHGIPFDLFWNTAGTFPGEIGITIQESLAPQEIIYTKPAGTGTAGTILFAGTAECIPPTCPKPNTITVTAVTQTDAIVNWIEAGTATQWEVYLVPTGSPAPTSSSVGVLTSTNPFPISGLTPATGYDVYVRAICSTTDISFWSNKKTFFTLIANDECSNATVVPVNPTIECVQTAPGSLIGATASADGNTCFGSDDDDVWFQFTATSAQHSISLINVAGSTTDLFHVLYSGTCGNLTQIYCSDPNSSVATNLVIGQTYYVRVYSWTQTPGQTSTFDICIGTLPPPITTNTTLYTTQQLVEDVFLNSTCASVSNITSSTGTNFGSTNGIGYFNKNGSSFPFADGIVLTSGDAINAPGPNSSTLGDGSLNWPGDTDLENIILAATGNAMNSQNASKLEFDFIPLTNSINFNFVFASEEYGTFQCNYSDAFAFLLTDIAAGTTTNLAVIPNTTTPVSVVTIRDNQYNTGCASVNPEYFGDYYGFGGTLDPLGSPTNFNGTTIPMSATSTVIPGHQYHIKLVIADRLDTIYDSAVFLEGGSLDIGNINLGNDFLQATNNALCTGENYTIQSGLDPATYTFSWTFNGNPIANETGPDLTVTVPGTYGISAQYINTTCAASDFITIEYYDPIVPGTPNNLIQCSDNGFAQFDLSQNNAASLGTLNPANYTVSYYATSADANAPANALPNLYTNTSNPQTIYVRIQNNTSGCYTVTSFQLIVTSQVLTPTFTNFTICTGDVASLPLVSNNGITGTWTPAFDNTQTATYTFTPAPNQCSGNGTITVTVNQKTPTTFNPISICLGGVAPTLPATSLEGFTGTWSPSTIDNTQAITYSFTPDAGQCAAIGTLTITPTPNVTPVFPLGTTLTACASAVATQVLLPTTSDNGITGIWSPSTLDYFTPGITVYTFTPTAGLCATNTTLTATILANVTPTFTQVAPICTGDTLGSLPTSSLEGITGIWTPAMNNTATTTYTFTPAPFTGIPSNLIVNGDFSSGNSSFSSDYQYLNNAGLNGVQKAYGVVAAANSWFQFFPACTSSAPSGGNMMVIDGSTTNAGNDIVWGQTVAVTPNTNYTFSYWMQTIATPNLANMEVLINGTSIGISTAPATNCSAAQYSYTWNSGANTTAQIAMYDRATALSGNDFSIDDISLLAAAGNPCATTATMTIVVNQKVTATFDAIGPLCIGEVVPPTLPATSNEGFTGTWSPATIDTTTSGIYTFTPDAGQCANNGSLAITVQNGFDFIIDGECIANDFTLTVSAVDTSFDVTTASYTWQDSNGLNIGTINPFNLTQYLASTPAEEAVPMTISVTVTTADGCKRTHEIVLDGVMCGIQKGISVNNDGLNDNFDLTGYNVKQLSIFNRYGLKVYSKSAYTNQWLGQSDSGDELPDGTYYYVIDFNNNQKAKTGWIYINKKQ